MSEFVESVDVEIKVNGKSYQRSIEPRMLLVEFLREELGLTGTHIGCDTSYCGACTVLMDGRPVKSCTVYAVQADGSEIDTVEGLEGEGELHTNFSLNRDGEYLALVSPDGTTVLSEFGTATTDYPDQKGNISFGFFKI